MLATIINILLIFIVLGLLITIHELGHFIAAKLSKVQVDEFSIGMGPAIFSKKYGETKYSLRVLPIGGYVKILGEGDDPSQDLKALKDNPKNFQNKNPFIKIFILSAGVLMNLLTAVIIYYGFLFQTDFKIITPDIDNYQPVFGTIEREIVDEKVMYQLADQGGAKDAGWPEKGYIKNIGLPCEVDEEGTKICPFATDGANGGEVVYSDQIINFVRVHRDREIEVEVCSEKDECAVYSTYVSEEGRVGIYLPANYVDVIQYKGIEKLLGGLTHSINVVHMGIVNIGQVFSEASESGDYDTAVNTVSSPIGLYFIVDFLREFGVAGMLDLIANLSVTLFIMNLLPIPALDGGRIVLVVLESALGKAYNKNVEAWAIRLSFIALMIFMLAIIVKDIVYWDTLKELFG